MENEGQMGRVGIWMIGLKHSVATGHECFYYHYISRRQFIYSEWTKSAGLRKGLSFSFKFTLL